MLMSLRATRNDDGTTPRDNPFFRAGAIRGGEVGANLQKVYAYGVRNGFGLAVDPFSGKVWDAQNGDDSFTEINQVEAGANLGWVQIMGPASRLAQFKGIETSPDNDPLLGTPYFGLQQLRWLPTNIADAPEEALARLFMVFDGRWKYIHASGFRPMLYDLLEDPSELTDRGEDPSCADVIVRLQSALFEWALHPKGHITTSTEKIAAYANQQLQVKGGILIGIWDEAELAAIRRAIRNCSTGWRPSSSGRAGASSKCTG